MIQGKHFISIWFFIGALLLAYGLLILGSAVYGEFVPRPRTVVLAELRADIWWGLLLTLLGGFYCWHFAPRRTGRD